MSGQQTQGDPYEIDPNKDVDDELRRIADLIKEVTERNDAAARAALHAKSLELARATLDAQEAHRAKLARARAEADEVARLTGVRRRQDRPLFADARIDDDDARNGDDSPNAPAPMSDDEFMQRVVKAFKAIEAMDDDQARMLGIDPEDVHGPDEGELSRKLLELLEGDRFKDKLEELLLGDAFRAMLLDLVSRRVHEYLGDGNDLVRGSVRSVLDERDGVNSRLSDIERRARGANERITDLEADGEAIWDLTQGLEAAVAQGRFIKPIASDAIKDARERLKSRYPDQDPAAPAS